jgi:hypothetical protein
MKLLSIALVIITVTTGGCVTMDDTLTEGKKLPNGEKLRVYTARSRDTLGIDQQTQVLVREIPQRVGTTKKVVPMLNAEDMPVLDNDGHMMMVELEVPIYARDENGKVARTIEIVHTNAASDHGIWKSIMPAAVTGVSMVATEAVHRPDKFESNSRTTFEGGNATLGDVQSNANPVSNTDTVVTASPTSTSHGGNGQGGQGGQGGSAQGGLGGSGYGGTGGAASTDSHNSSSMVNSPHLAANAQQSQDARTSSQSNQQQGQHADSRQNQGMQQGQTQASQNSMRQGQGQSSNNRNNVNPTIEGSRANATAAGGNARAGAQSGAQSGSASRADASNQTTNDNNANASTDTRIGN